MGTLEGGAEGAKVPSGVLALGQRIENRGPAFPQHASWSQKRKPMRAAGVPGRAAYSVWDTAGRFVLNRSDLSGDRSSEYPEPVNVIFFWK